MTIENELQEACPGLAGEEIFTDRQAWLRSLAYAAQKLTDTQFDQLSGATYQWCNWAAKSIKASQPIPDPLLVKVTKKPPRKDAVLLLVLSRLQAEGKKLADLTPEAQQAYINEAIADWALVEQLANAL